MIFSCVNFPSPVGEADPPEDSRLSEAIETNIRALRKMLHMLPAFCLQLKNYHATTLALQEALDECEFSKSRRNEARQRSAINAAHAALIEIWLVVEAKTDEQFWRLIDQAMKEAEAVTAPLG